MAQRIVFGGEGPKAGDIDDLVSALKAAARELNTADTKEGRYPPTAQQFQQNIPVYMGHLQNLRKLAAASGKRIPIQHYREFLEGIKADNAAILKHHEGYRDGKVLTPPLSINYITLYALQLAIAIQQEPLEERYHERPDAIGRDEMDLLDTAIRLSQGQAPDVESTAAPSRRYSVKH